MIDKRFPRLPATAWAALLTIVLAAGCTTATPARTGTPAPPTTGLTPAPTPATTPAPTPVPDRTVESAAQAAALVFASDPRWANMLPLRPDVIGASQWYEAYAEAGGFGVVITAGSGDCMAGCIDQRRWIYHVDTNGAVELVREEGDDVELTSPLPSDEPSEVRVTLSAGPVCPVEQNPPDPNCADRPVVNALVTLYAADGTEVAVTTSPADGVVAFEVDPGAYYVVAQPVQGLMGTPEAQAFAVAGGSHAGLHMSYDTGIR